MSINDTEKKRGRGRPPKDTVQVGLRLDASMVEQIDAVLLEETDNPPRPEMIRRILRDWLRSR